MTVGRAEFRVGVVFVSRIEQAERWKKAGVDARIHDLRHTTGMRTLRKTGNLQAARKEELERRLATARRVAALPVDPLSRERVIQELEAELGKGSAEIGRW
jgi:hypothetical protein